MAVVVPAVDVPVTMQLKFQQSLQYVFVKVPQIQFIVRLCEHSVLHRDKVQTVQNCGVPQLQCSDKVVDVPAVAVHRQGVDVPVILQRRCLAVGGASDSAHRHSQRTIQLHRDGSAFSVGDGDEGDFRDFSAFFVFLRVVPELSARFSSPR